MTFNHQKAYAILQRQHQKEKEMLLAAGISEKRIMDLFESDIQQLKKDRVYFLHATDSSLPNEQLFVDPNEPDSQLQWQEQIENPILLEALKSLSPGEIEVINLHINEQLPLTFVAAFLDRPYANVQRQYHRAIQKLKKIFF